MRLFLKKKRRTACNNFNSIAKRRRNRVGSDRGKATDQAHAEMMLAVMLRERRPVMTVDQLKVTSQHLARKRLCICGSLRPKRFTRTPEPASSICLRDKARTLGFREVEIIDDDLVPVRVGRESARRIHTVAGIGGAGRSGMC